MHIRRLLPVALAAALAFVGCDGEESATDRSPAEEVTEGNGTDSGTPTSDAEQEGYMLPAAHDPSCESVSERRGITPPVQWIRVEGDDISAAPETLVQPPGTGVFGWKGPKGWFWEVTFTDNVYPTMKRSYSGQPNGRPVIAPVRDDAPCRYYKWDIKMWERGAGAGDTVRSDPGGLVEPWGG